MRGFAMKHVLVLVAVLGFAVTTDIATVSVAVAETQGMDRRDDRRDNRDDAREGKRECKAGDESSRPECRQDKRDDKREGGGTDDDEREAETEGEDK
jgi:hypothetical protein